MKLLFRTVLTYVLILMVHSAWSQANQQIKTGVGAYWDCNGDFIGGITIQYNRVIKDSRFKSSINYHYHQSKGYTKNYNNGVLVSEIYYKILFHHFSYLLEFTIFRSKKDTNRGLAVGIGPGYVISKKSGIKNYYGPGGAIKLEYQGKLRKKWYYGIELYGMYFADLNKEHSGSPWLVSLMPPTLTLGLRF
jgi:hypothetical protein